MLYNQQTKLFSGERVDETWQHPMVSGMKHGSILIMQSSSLEHLRTEGEGDGAGLQMGAGKG